MKWFFVVLSILFANPVVAQDLPDFKKLIVEEQDGHDGEYNGEKVAVLHEHYEYYDSKSQVHHDLEVFYKPIPLSIFIGSDDADKIDFIEKSRSKGILFVIHSTSSPQASIDKFYIRTRKWYEIHRLWRPRWRLLSDWKLLKTGSNEDKVLKNKFGLILYGSIFPLSN